MRQDNVARLTTIRPLVRSLTKDAGHVHLADELAVKVFLGTLAIQRAVSADRAVGAHHDGFANRHALGVALDDRIANRVSVGDRGICKRRGVQAPRGAGLVEGSGSNSRRNQRARQGELIAVVGAVLVEPVFSAGEDEDISTIRTTNSQRVIWAEAVLEVLEVLEVRRGVDVAGDLNPFRGGRSRAASLKGDAGSVGRSVVNGEGFAQGRFRVERGADGAEAVMVNRVVFADHMAIHIDVAAGEEDIGFALGSGRSADCRKIVALSLERDKGLAGGSKNVAIDFVFAVGSDHRGLSSAGLQLLANTNDGVVADGVGGEERILVSRRGVGQNVVFAVALVEEQLLKTLGLDPAQPVAQKNRDIGLEFGGDGDFFLGPLVVGDGMTEEIHRQLERAKAEVFRLVLHQFVALDALSEELGHRAERDFGSRALGKVADGLYGVAVAGSLELLEEVLGGLRQLYAFPPEFRKKGVVRR